ncbi:MAG: S-layer homology domain-containing protein [Oscillospiraceae bacterium]|nr:S-layer homology domain-containing protein [Oscillospiraceae bacterium]
MKQRLLRALALLLVCALMCTTALAFTDDKDIGDNYKDAVEAMVKKGVIEGYDDGSFKPGETLTREQGAKIIAFLCLGKTAAEALTCKKAPFDDVAADRWSAPYIAWCVEKNIVNGYGDGNFGPGDTLTGDQYAKMLLCALGLAKNVSAYTGDDWYKAVRADAKAAGLYDGDPTMESSEPITRGQAALLSWNTSQASEAAQKPSTPATPSGGGSSGGGSSGGASGGGSSGGDSSGGASGGGSSGGDSSGGSTSSGGSSGGGSPSGGSSGGDSSVRTDDNGDIMLPEVP